MLRLDDPELPRLRLALRLISGRSLLRLDDPELPRLRLALRLISGRSLIRLDDNELQGCFAPCTRSNLEISRSSERAAAQKLRIIEPSLAARYHQTQPGSSSL